MARYAVDMKEMLEGKVVVELGCGCGVPGLAAGTSVFVYHRDLSIVYVQAN